MGLKIVLITSGQPSINPRIVKEADILATSGHSVTLLYCYWIDWAEATDKTLLQKVKWEYIKVGGDPKNGKKEYLFSRIRYKIYRKLQAFFGNRLLLAERAQARCYEALLKQACNIKADWYIAHNLGAIAVAEKAAKKNNAKCGFDFEDYHRYESDDFSKSEYERIVFLERKYVPSMSYLSAASPMIAERVQNDFPDYSQPIVNIFNCFPKNQQPDFRIKKKDDKSLKLFWFSQTVGKNRGLETLLDALLILNDSTIFITLAGRLDPDFEIFIRNKYASIFKNIHFAGPQEPDVLPLLASTFDVGLALEPLTPLNKDICLANKVFTYLIAGTGIILTNTKMQYAFNEKYPVGQITISGDSKNLALAINKFKDIDFLNQQRIHNYKLAESKFNWEEESTKLIALIK